jgi:hypothetical protein
MSLLGHVAARRQNEQQRELDPLVRRQSCQNTVKKRNQQQLSLCV